MTCPRSGTTCGPPGSGSGCCPPRRSPSRSAEQVRSTTSRPSTRHWPTWSRTPTVDLVGLGMVSLEDADTCRTQLVALADTAGIAGVAIPPVLAGASLDRGVLHEILVTAADLDLAVLVHPMQLPRPEWSDHYLANLIGNPTETATAVAATISRRRHRGTAAAADLLRARRWLRPRVCWVGGSTAGTIAPTSGHIRSGRRRTASGSCSSTPSPTTVICFGCWPVEAGERGVVCGSDYPFDMAQQDPVRFAVEHGITADSLTAHGRAFLGSVRPTGISLSPTRFRR